MTDYPLDHEDLEGLRDYLQDDLPDQVERFRETLGPAFTIEVDLASLPVEAEVEVRLDDRLVDPLHDALCDEDVEQLAKATLKRAVLGHATEPELRLDGDAVHLTADLRADGDEWDDEELKDRVLGLLRPLLPEGDRRRLTKEVRDLLEAVDEHGPMLQAHFEAVYQHSPNVVIDVEAAYTDKPGERAAEELEAFFEQAHELWKAITATLQGTPELVDAFRDLRELRIVYDPTATEPRFDGRNAWFEYRAGIDTSVRTEQLREQVARRILRRGSA